MSTINLRAGLALIAFSWMAAPTMAEDAKPNKQAAEDNPMGYFLGISIGQQMAKQGFQVGDFDVASLSAGVTDGLNKLDPALTEEALTEVKKNLDTLLGGRQKALMEEREKMAMLNKEKGELWLKQNAKKKGIKTLEGGVQYKVLKEGDGGKPSKSDTVKVHYTGTLTTGKVFDSSVKRGEPAEFKVGNVIEGWQMALQEMKVGDKWMLYIPSNLAYGPRGSAGAIGPNEVLVFEVELLDII